MARWFCVKDFLFCFISNGNSFIAEVTLVSLRMHKYETGSNFEAKGSLDLNSDLCVPIHHTLFRANFLEKVKHFLKLCVNTWSSISVSVILFVCSVLFGYTSSSCRAWRIFYWAVVDLSLKSFPLCTILYYGQCLIRSSLHSPSYWELLIY